MQEGRLLTIGVTEGAYVVGVVAAVIPCVRQPALVKAVVELRLVARAAQVGGPDGARGLGHALRHRDGVAVREALAATQHPGVVAVPVAVADGPPLAVNSHLHSAQVGRGAVQAVGDGCKDPRREENDHDNRFESIFYFYFFKERKKEKTKRKEKEIR